MSDSDEFRWAVYCRGCGIEINGDLRRILGKSFCEECYAKITAKLVQEGVLHSQEVTE